MKALPLGGMPLDVFLNEYWQKKPLFIPKALPDINSPLEGDFLAGLACEEGVESRLIIRHGENWELQHGPFTDEQFADLPESNWTLLVQAVDHWVPEAASLLEQFNFIPRWRIDDLMMSYASDGGGVGPHFDNYDVFLVQTSGKRLWEIGGRCEQDAPIIDDLPVKILSEFKALESWVLEPGDILYVPPGFSHNGVAQGNDCITCSVGFRAPSHSEILLSYTDYLSDKLTDAQRYEDPDLLIQENTGELSAQTLKKIQHILRHYAEDEKSIADWFGRYISTPKYQQPAQLELQESEVENQISDLREHLEAGRLLVRNEGSRFAFRAEQGNKILFADGISFDNRGDLNELIEVLCSEIELNKESFTQTDNNLGLILKLLHLGAIYLAER